MLPSEVTPAPTPEPTTPPALPADVVATLAPEQWDVLLWGLGIVCFGVGVLIALRF